MHIFSVPLRLETKNGLCHIHTQKKQIVQFLLLFVKFKFLFLSNFFKVLMVEQWSKVIYPKAASCIELIIQQSYQFYGNSKNHGYFFLEI